MSNGQSRIAVIGWGSLYWQPKSLDIDLNWQLNGPRLPVEFARVSEDGRLTLVLVQGVPLQTTLWVVSRKPTLDEAVEDLRVREGTISRSIGYWSRAGGLSVEDLSGEIIAKWADPKGFSSVVWTALGPTNLEKRPGLVSDQERLHYLRGLVSSGREAAAKEYIERAPAKIETPFRALVRRELGWGKNP